MKYPKRAARPKNSRDHGKFIGRELHGRNYSRIVPLRRKRGARRYTIPNPVRSPTYDRERKRRERRKHRLRVQRALERIMYVLPGGLEYSPFTDRIRAVLEDVL